ncbi:MAG: 4'-phosphopantetheinyl transferase superfamily protein [Deltaproteobacteria bacterium]|nr:4'-phosphopantetheinyl transferase superfamily protein [Deltaproteobacteria bacterium]TLN04908.1 MAG: 4'-phosphopantetheinyl transferase superfamily protein [bacterium]
MKVPVAINYEGVTVHQLDAIRRRGPVFYASSAGDNETCRHLLISTLWDHLLTVENPLRQHAQSANGAALPIQVVRGPLGRPQLLVGESRGPAISFSEGGGKVWAALAGDESALGIDVAGSDEFLGDYPFPRVFHPHELEHAVNLTGGNMAGAAALLWSVKEAVVKALGCAFHLVEPRQINVYPPAGGTAGEGGYTFSVGLAGKAQERFPLVERRSFRVQSLARDTLWLSLALLERSLTGHE